MKIRKAMLVLGVIGAAVAGPATSAFALDCSNLSRPAPAQPATPLEDLSADGGPVVYAIDGNWWFVSFDDTFADGFWDFVPPGSLVNVLRIPATAVAAMGLPASAVHGNYQAGQGFGLLDNAQAPCVTFRQTSHGIQGESFRCSSGG